jgi:hypothetical protein
MPQTNSGRPGPERSVTRQPIDLAAVDARNKAQTLRIAADERVYLSAAPYDPIERAYRFDEQPNDLFDGSNITEEVMGLVWAGLLTDRGGSIRTTDAGRAALGEW